MRLLVVEDEPEMAGALQSALRRHDMIADHADSLATAKEMILAGSYDAIILDRGLPDGDGLSLIPKIRQHRASIPVIVLTARGRLAERITGLDSGADDYLAKPFAFEELLARLRAVMRRPDHISPMSVKLGRLSLDLDHREARVEDMRFDLPRRELLVLEALMRRAGRMVPREILMESVFGMSDEVQSNTLDSHISRLRRKLADADAGVTINGVRGVGYMLMEQI
ncbi:response regulator transcription factor [Rhizobium miluonense]|uniref:DNA-binding response regulator, OmpR family, contains REC and winged-helix (WHTH) domain n=1 Tax=Rhizobium miluonense TaxID=411945 RepID=A0A1C3WTG0_9HYPH|nr:response regulator transcription factor [Rhizobium miluonense]SCB43195.1 DNA-binding response regulator, OmpR family, contains REC and winged-helix (wHTH) domain [Rhizobium miluonense]